MQRLAFPRHDQLGVCTLVDASAQTDTVLHMCVQCGASWAWLARQFCRGRANGQPARVTIRLTLARFGADADGCANLDERLCIGSQRRALPSKVQLKLPLQNASRSSSARKGGTPLFLGADEAWSRALSADYEAA